MRGLVLPGERATAYRVGMGQHEPVGGFAVVVVRPTPGGVSLLLSDAAAALDYDIAADVLDLLRVEPPDEDDEEVWPEGNLAILSDIGLPEGELLVIIEEVDL